VVDRGFDPRSAQTKNTIKLVCVASPHLQKVVLHSITARFYLRPSHFVISLSFSNICHVTLRKLRLPLFIMGDDLHIKNCTYLAIYIKLGPTHVRHINIFRQGKIISFFLMVICNSLLLLKSLPIKIQKVLFKVDNIF
jgi:hypothetical protein